VSKPLRYGIGVGKIIEYEKLNHAVIISLMLVMRG
jgi:hypothetical protein